MRNNRIGIDSGSSNQINESISEKYVTHDAKWWMLFYFSVINNYMGCNEINQHRLKNNIY